MSANLIPSSVLSATRAILRALTTTALLFALIGCSQEQPPEQPTRRWVGADYFPMPLHDWQRRGDTLVAKPASYGGHWGAYKARLYHATATVGTTGTFSTQFHLRQVKPSRKKERRMGVWLGLKSKTPSPQNVWIHPKRDPLFVGVSHTGRLQIGDLVTHHYLNAEIGVQLNIVGRLTDTADYIEVTAKVGQNRAVTAEHELPAGTLTGSLSLLAQGKQSEVHFKHWTVDGSALDTHIDRAVGPILWSQYTLQDSGTLKLQAQMVPLEETDSAEAVLEFEQDGRWIQVATAALEPLSSTFLFRVANVSAENAVSYRVKYLLADEPHYWSGTVRANPREKRNFSLGVFNCDHGELFPQDTMVRNVTQQNPDMLFFAGDQIYEGMDGVEVVREPLEGARLSYLSKYYQFGLTWRHLLKNRPSVIIPDDHDVFMPNVWGDRGDGYSMPPKWVNMVQRTQTGSLPDPIDPEPVRNDIQVYFTALDYAGMSFAIAEDRKFKTHPRFAKGIPRKPEFATKLDVKDAQLLGARQLKFVRQWRKRTEPLPVRWFLSQSMFSKGTTHIGAKLRRFEIDMDTNGWPQTARNQALRSIGRSTIMVNGDQHIGMLARLGIKTWDDGPLSFMVTGSSVGHPRAWWPEVEPIDGPINGPFTGRYIDDLTNHITVLGVTNPTPIASAGDSAWTRPDVASKGVFAVQAAKGSGHGIVTVDKAAKTATFSAYTLDFDASKPTQQDQFPGFPITQPLR